MLYKLLRGASLKKSAFQNNENRNTKKIMIIFSTVADYCSLFYIFIYHIYYWPIPVAALS
jgi:hypothetical protein